MPNKILNYTLWSVAILFTFILYWPLMHGTPIWDDFGYWFIDPIMKADFPYLTIWKNFGWPFSVSIQKLTLSLFEKNYFYYHLLSFIIHSGNALLVYQLGRRLRLKYYRFYFILFLLHPVAVITTGWMIQLKTLICFFFGLSSLLIFLKGQKNLKWLLLSLILFFFSITSKSASLTLPLIYLAIHFKFHRFHKIHYLIPFFILSIWGGYRVLTSPVTIHGTENAAEITQLKSDDFVKTKTKIPEVTPTEVPPTVSATNHQSKPKETKNIPIPPVPEKLPEPTIQINSEEKTSFTFLSLNFDLLLQTSYYYFWQTILPINNAPVKGLNLERAGLEEYVHLFFLFTLIWIFWKDIGLIYLLAAHFLIAPFLGLIPAPFMNVTWVSDQHLYLALPAFLAFWFRLIERIPWKFNWAIPLVFVLFFSYKTWKITPIYKSQIAFYKASLEYNPRNIPIAYNLAFTYLLGRRWVDAYYLITETYHLVEMDPALKKNRFYPNLLILYYQMNQGFQNEN